MVISMKSNVIYVDFKYKRVKVSKPYFFAVNFYVKIKEDFLKRWRYMRIGLGYDVHRLVKDRDLILGGVKIPHELGLLGHSDADVLIHAIMDSLLGASA